MFIVNLITIRPEIKQACLKEYLRRTELKYFMAFTYTYFRPKEYDGFTSPKFEIHEIEWCKIGAGDEPS